MCIRRWHPGSDQQDASRNVIKYAHEKSDKCIVPMKSSNKDSGSAETTEGRCLAKGNSQQTTTPCTQRQENVSSGLEAVRKAAQAEKGEKLTALLHHVTPERLRESYHALKRNVASGVDGVTWEVYGENLGDNLRDLHKRIHTGTYRAQPAKRIYLPKPDGTRRPINIQCIEDKVAQQAIVTVLTEVYEADFLGFSYGFRPGRGQHDALDALQCGLVRRRVSWVLDTDIRGFFDAVDHEWMMKFLQHRIGDKRILRLISKWMKVGTIDDGERRRSTQGTPQGAVISPLLANVYLHYVFDLWSHAWRGRHAQGDVIIVRYADDTVAGFQHAHEAGRFLEQLKERMRKFGLELHAEKTRMIRFGRFATRQCKERGQGKPETFDFLGFTHYCSRARKSGKFIVGRKTNKKKMRAQLQAIKSALRRRLHRPVGETGQWLHRVLTGHMNYYAVPGNMRSLESFSQQVKIYWLKSLRRRSQRSRMTWERFSRLLKMFFPPIRILHPLPAVRFDARTQGRSPVR
jgi:RNA-directed DNA polymerase